MGYHLISNHGIWEVWNETFEMCAYVAYFPTMGQAMSFIAICKLGESFKAA